MSPARQRRRGTRAARATRQIARHRRLPLALAAVAAVAAASSAALGGAAIGAAPRVEAGLHDPYELPYPQVNGGFGDYPTLPTAPGLPVPTTTTPTVPTQPPSGPTTFVGQLAGNGIPVVALRAYRNAEQRLAVEQPGCGLHWSLLAAIGRVESNHGQFAGAQLLLDGRSSPPVRGLPLDGRPNLALISDSDGGQYDGDTVFDRAVGPMQFIPTTWSLYAVDGDGDRTADPYDIDDAALAAGNYLCRAGGNLRTPLGLHNAVFAYNHSEDYVRLVLDLATEYASGVRVDQLPPGKAQGGPLPTPPGTPPPATIGPPPAATPTPTPTPTPPTTPPPSTTPPVTTTPTPTPTDPTPTPTDPTPTPTDPTPTPTDPTPTPTDPTPTPTPTETPADTGTPTPTETPADESTPTPTPTPESEPTGSPEPTSTASSGATEAAGG